MRTWWPGGLSFALLSGCSGAAPPAAEEIVVPDACDERDDGFVCEDGVALSCAGGDIAASDDCGARGLGCSAERGCELCRPDRYSCDGERVMLCNHEGSELRFIEECSDGLSCSPRGCRDLCADAEAARSYVGCEYWPVITRNSQLDPLFDPAVVVGNPNLVSARVKVTKAGVMVDEIEVAAGAAETIMLPLEASDPLRNAPSTALVPQGAYHLVSSVPVIVHQFNPLLFEVDEYCTDVSPEERDAGVAPKECFSHTNDASLLLPAHVLGRPSDGGIAYLGISRASAMTTFGVEGGAFGGLSGFLTLVGVAATPVNVTVRSSAYTRAERELEVSDGGVPALSPGDTYSLQLGQGDVLQLLTQVPSECEGKLGETTRTPPEQVCDPGPAYDLTGTSIEADGPLQVIGGHDCTYVPFDRTACDHLEETIFPVETWGKQVIVGKPRDNDRGTLYVLRVVSAADDNTIRFEPARAEPVTLQRGEWHELELTQDVQVLSTEPMAVAQFLIGQGSTRLDGDPSFTLVPPVEQYRTSYNFLSPATYTSNFVTLVAPVGVDVVLDGNTVTGFEPLGDTGYAVATRKLLEPGDHEVHAENAIPIGIMLYGVGAYTSYMLPGGLDLRVIADTF